MADGGVARSGFVDPRWQNGYGRGSRPVMASLCPRRSRSASGSRGGASDLLPGDHDGPVLGTLAQVVADGSVDVAGCVDATQVRDVIHQWRLNGNVAWKLPLLQRILDGAFTGKESTPFGGGSVHDFMHAKATVCDDTLFVGSFNLSRSGEKNAENVLQIEDATLATASPRSSTRCGRSTGR